VCQDGKLFKTSLSSIEFYHLQVVVTLPSQFPTLDAMYAHSIQQTSPLHSVVASLPQLIRFQTQLAYSLVAYLLVLINFKTEFRLRTEFH